MVILKYSIYKVDMHGGCFWVRSRAPAWVLCRYLLPIPVRIYIKQRL